MIYWLPSCVASSCHKIDPGCFRVCAWGVSCRHLRLRLPPSPPFPLLPCPVTLTTVLDRSLSFCGSKYVEVIREKVQDGLTGETREMQYTQCKIVGNGSFGVVFQTKMSPSGEDAAIKRVLQDKRFKVGSHRTGRPSTTPPSSNSTQNRELQIMRIVRHPNIVELKAFYYSNGERVCLPFLALFMVAVIQSVGKCHSCMDRHYKSRFSRADDAANPRRIKRTRCF